MFTTAQMSTKILGLFICMYGLGIQHVVCMQKNQINGSFMIQIEMQLQQYYYCYALSTIVSLSNECKGKKNTKKKKNKKRERLPSP